ncbi:DUF1549 domain-containing protein [Thalassoglobus sp. JC818]|uniref:DUF1549 domain-containing protein n=1 Tax=Thalassoglobus sp. JC818 TaxID=3232136 RepID=UPI0034577E87
MAGSISVWNSTSHGSEHEFSSRIDHELQRLLLEENVEVAPQTSDEDFLRRAYLDLIGRVPSSSEINLFGLDPDLDKRAKVIDTLIASEEFAKFWGRYFKQLVTSRATEQRIRLVEPAFETWFIEQISEGRSWDEITRDLITATGSVMDSGATGLIFSHTGEPQEVAAEISRIFLGIQLSCANCHDHPTDSWTRDEFHGLAAFLPRVTVRREEPGDPRSFAVRSLEQSNRRARPTENFDQIFRALDRNRDGFLIKSEARGQLASRFDQILAGSDTNKDGKLSLKEFENVRNMANMPQPGRGELEYFMPDLNNPASQGTLTQPVFFIPEVRGPEIHPGSSDLTRRHALADYVTSPTNPWFARAFVNRVWAEMLGKGFYMPVDDMGPERFALYEPVLDMLAQGFADHGYDIKWVYRTIANTQAYQRRLVAIPTDEYQPPFASAVPTRLSADQIFQSLQEVLDVNSMSRFPGRNRGNAIQQRYGIDPERNQFVELFGVDPSTPSEDIIGNIPQALFVMNSPIIEQNIRGTGNSMLARLLREYPDDEDALSELYLRVLSREPTAREMSINTRFLSEIKNRNEAFEDIYWSLLNSTEFITRR